MVIDSVLMAPTKHGRTEPMDKSASIRDAATNSKN